MPLISSRPPIVQTPSMPTEALKLVTRPSWATPMTGMPPIADVNLHGSGSGQTGEPSMMPAITPPMRSVAVTTSRSLTCA